MAIALDELRGSSLCRDLSDEELGRVAEWFDATSFSEGAPGYSFFVGLVSRMRLCFALSAAR